MPRALRTDGISLQLRVIGLLYGAAYLEGRQRAGLRLSRLDQKRLEQLSKLLEGDAERGRRRHRRVSSTLPALIKVKGRFAPALILNMSAGGFLVATPSCASDGQHVQVKVGAPEQVEYHFPCQVVRSTQPHGASHLALAFSSIPLEVRHGRSEHEVTPPQGVALARA